MKTISKSIYISRNNDYTEGEQVAKNQIHKSLEIIDKLGYNLTTCGSCGAVNIIDVSEEEHECYLCQYEGECCDFPDLFYDGMTITREVRANDVDGNILKPGDAVVVLDGEGLDLPIPRGTTMYVERIVDHESNFIEFDSAGTTHAFYGDRVLKLKQINFQ